jgi:predicted dehydrogenase
LYSEKKVVIVGAGEVANKSHLPAYRRIKRSKVVAICDVNKEIAEKTARFWNVPHHYTSFEGCLKEETPDLVDICTPPNSHLQLILQTLKAGSHVIVEKPLVTSLSECEEVEKVYHAFRHRGLRIGVIHNWLFEFFTPIISSIVKSRELGEIQRVEVDIFARQDDPMISNPNHWCHSLMGGRIGECLIHPVYILQHYFGKLKVTHVSVFKRGQYSWVAFDELFATLKSSEGKLGHIYITFNSPRADFPVILVYGSKKHLLYHNSNLVTLGSLGYTDFKKGLDNLRQISHILKSLCRHVARRVFRTKEYGHEVFIADFINSIIEENEPYYSFEEALQATYLYLEILNQITIKDYREPGLRC